MTRLVLINEPPAWVTRVFSTATNLSTNPSTGDEIRRFVQAFLDARGRVIPPPRRPQPRAVAEDSQESQRECQTKFVDMVTRTDTVDASRVHFRHN